MTRAILYSFINCSSKIINKHNQVILIKFDGMAAIFPILALYFFDKKFANKDQINIQGYQSKKSTKIILF